MKIKTAEAKEQALDWLVAKREGRSYSKPWFDDDTHGNEIVKPYSPSTDWAQGGPIIEREKIGIDCDDQGVWFASYDLSAETAWGATGPTPLIAAMRCYVASKLGDEVEIPEEV